MDPALARPVVSEHYELVAGDTLEQRAEASFLDLKDQYGNYMLNFSRVELHELLRSFVAGSRSGHSAGKINLGCQVEDLDCESGTIYLAGGRTAQKDLVIVADGVKVRSWLL